MTIQKLMGIDFLFENQMTYYKLSRQGHPITNKMITIQFEFIVSIKLFNETMKIIFFYISILII